MQTTAVRVALSVCLCVRGLEQQLYKIDRTNRVTVCNVDPLQETVYIRWGSGFSEERPVWGSSSTWACGVLTTNDILNIIRKGAGVMCPVASSLR